MAPSASTALGPGQSQKDQLLKRWVSWLEQMPGIGTAARGVLEDLGWLTKPVISHIFCKSVTRNRLSWHFIIFSHWLFITCDPKQLAEGETASSTLVTVEYCWQKQPENDWKLWMMKTIENDWKLWVWIVSFHWKLPGPQAVPTGQEKPSPGSWGFDHWDPQPSTGSVCQGYYGPKGSQQHPLAGGNGLTNAVDMM